MNRCRTLLSVDPGKHDAGVAFFVDGVLADVAFLSPPGGGPYEVARTVASWAARCMMNLGDPSGRVNLLICEGQQIYRGGRVGKQDPNDLLPLAQVVGGVMARVEAFERRVILPKDWTGGIPKPVRQRHFLSGASEWERSQLLAIKPATKRHNVVDAVMMGAYVLGRLKNEPEGGYTQ
jgi:hypothetical protein